MTIYSMNKYDLKYGRQLKGPFTYVFWAQQPNVVVSRLTVEFLDGAQLNTHTH
jgi:hypothetical protein